MPGHQRFGDGTRCVHAGARRHPVGAPLHESPVFAAPYQLAVDDGTGVVAHGDYYGRAGNPTWRVLESAIGELDGGECVVWPSGMAAIAALLRAVLRRGDRLVLPSDGYYAVRRFVAEQLVELDLDVREIPTAGPWDSETFDGVRLVMLETPSNPGLDVCDVGELAERAHRAGAFVAVDNTTATPLGQRPLELGADVVVASDTKALAGHSDVLLGHVSVREGVLLGEESLTERLRVARTLSGAIAGPFETWLVHRGLSTLDVRLARQAENAAAVAEFLRAQPSVRSVRWPGLVDDPSHAVARRQMLRFGGVVSFELANAGAVAELVGASELLVAATSFGGVRSTVDRRAQWGDNVSSGFVRLSLGCENPEDLVDDFRRALR